MQWSRPCKNGPPSSRMGDRGVSPWVQRRGRHEGCRGMAYGRGGEGRREDACADRTQMGVRLKALWLWLQNRL